VDPAKKIVSDGYDRVHQRYLELVASMGMQVREKYLTRIRGELPQGARLLELGCGTGVPMTRALARSYQVTGLEISAKQVVLARQSVPAASFIRGDMTRLGFATRSFDAAVSFYAITHVPRDEHMSVLAEVHRVLRPGGLLVITMGAGDSPDMVEADWLGAPMFFSHFDGATNEALVARAGFEIASAEDEWEAEEGTPVCFHWIVAKKVSR